MSDLLESCRSQFFLCFLTVIFPIRENVVLPLRMSRIILEGDGREGTKIICFGHQNSHENAAFTVWDENLSDKGIIFKGNFTSLCQISSKGRKLEDLEVINVLDFGAVGDGKTDDSRAFLRGFQAACNVSGASSLVIPTEKTFLLSPIIFRGFCKTKNIHVQILGKLIALDSRLDWEGGQNAWLTFHQVDGLIIEGLGQIDSRGSIWWQCKVTGECNNGPTTLRLKLCNNVRVNGLMFINSPQRHIDILDCKEVYISQLSIIAPGDSPNTDGIHLKTSQRVQITNCSIQTGDDCISIGNNVMDVNISGIFCGPGHGISVGSLGSGDSPALVEKIHVSNCTFAKSLHGVRIKTWQGGSGFARDITFRQIVFNLVDQPIIIDQFYCNGLSPDNCPVKASAVNVSDVRFIRAYGTANNESIFLSCSDTIACTNIVLCDIQINTTNSMFPASICNNVQGILVPPVSPLIHFPCPPENLHSSRKGSRSMFKNMVLYRETTILG